MSGDQSKDDTWDFVIEESARQLQECESRAARLRVCLEYFEGRKASGDPFPGKDILRKKRLLPPEFKETE